MENGLAFFQKNRKYGRRSVRRFLFLSWSGISFTAYGNVVDAIDAR